jgi:hypothetical protein
MTYINIVSSLVTHGWFRYVSLSHGGRGTYRKEPWITDDGIVYMYVIRNMMLCWDCANQIATMMVYDIMIKYIVKRFQLHRKYEKKNEICFLNSMQVLIDKKKYPILLSIIYENIKIKNTGIFYKLAIVGYEKSYQPYSRSIDNYISNP